MRVTFSECMEEFGLEDLAEYSNHFTTRLALANVGGYVHVCHELTTCRDNVAWMLHRLKNFRDNIMDEDDHCFGMDVVYEGGLYSSEEDMPSFDKACLVLSTNAPQERIDNLQKVLKHYSKIVGSKYKPTVENLGYYDKYETDLYLIQVGVEFLPAFMHSFLTLAIRFHMERPIGEYLTDWRRVGEPREELEAVCDGAELVDSMFYGFKRNGVKYNAIRTLISDKMQALRESLDDEPYAGVWKFIVRSHLAFSDKFRETYGEDMRSFRSWER